MFFEEFKTWINRLTKANNIVDTVLTMSTVSPDQDQ